MAARILLVLSILTFGGLGIAFAFQPKRMAATVDLVLPTPTARADLMATYGGFEIGFALFLLICLFRGEAGVAQGLLASGLVLAGFGTARLAGILTADGPVRSLMYWLLAIEVVATAACLWLARRP